jgi:hypothetical protein
VEVGGEDVELEEDVENNFISIILLNTMIRTCLNRYKRLD